MIRGIQGEPGNIKRTKGETTRRTRGTREQGNT